MFSSLLAGEHRKDVRMPSHLPDPSTPAPESIVRQLDIPFHLLDPSTPAGKSVARRLHDDLFIWLITVDETYVPHPLPVTFLWDDAQSTLLIYSMPQAERDRLEHIRHHPRVALHFDVSGGDIMIITGEAHVSSDDPSFDQLPAWVEKYHDLYPRMGTTLQHAAAVAPVALRVRPLQLRYAPNPIR